MRHGYIAAGTLVVFGVLAVLFARATDLGFSEDVKWGFGRLAALVGGISAVAGAGGAAIGIARRWMKDGQ